MGDTSSCCSTVGDGPKAEERLYFFKKKLYDLTTAKQCLTVKWRWKLKNVDLNRLRSEKQTPIITDIVQLFLCSGTVLHFLVRLPPFTQLFLDYQDSSFDIPDRTFHSMETTYRLSSYASTTDVKELIPEFFFLPEFLCNLEGLCWFSFAASTASSFKRGLEISRCQRF